MTSVFIGRQYEEVISAEPGRRHPPTARSNRPASELDGLTVARLTGAARRHAPGREPSGAETAAAVRELREIAGGKGVSVAQVAFAWVLSRGEDIVPLVGARRRDQLEEALGALDVALSPDDLERIEAAVPPDAAAGDRYGAPQMADLDSERG